MMNSIKFRLFLLAKIPIAFLAGLRLKDINNQQCRIKIRHSWMNQNPFNSMYFAVQAMAAEISTGLLVFRMIELRKKNISMLVTEQQAVFSKKATGKIIFSCENGKEILEAIDKAIESREGQIVWVESIGTDEKGDKVSSFRFQWSLKVR